MFTLKKNELIGCTFLEFDLENLRARMEVVPNCVISEGEKKSIRIEHEISIQLTDSEIEILKDDHCYGKSVGWQYRENTHPLGALGLRDNGVLILGYNGYGNRREIDYRGVRGEASKAKKESKAMDEAWELSKIWGMNRRERFEKVIVDFVAKWNEKSSDILRDGFSSVSSWDFAEEDQECTERSTLIDCSAVLDAAEKELESQIEKMRIESFKMYNRILRLRELSLGKYLSQNEDDYYPEELKAELSEKISEGSLFEKQNPRRARFM